MREDYGSCQNCTHELYGKCYVKTSRDNFYSQTEGEWTDEARRELESEIDGMCSCYWHRSKTGKEIDRMQATKREAERGGCAAESIDAAAAAVRKFERCMKRKGA